MKKFLIILLAAAFLALPGMATAACQKGSFGKIKGPINIQIGQTYTYSVLVNGTFKSGRWSISGGQLLKDWSEGDTFYGKVKWQKMDPNDPSKVKVFGKDGCGKDRAERLFVTAGESRSPQNDEKQCGAISKIQGPETVVFGQVYTYSSVVKGSFKQGGWSATGGDVLKDWWQDNTYYAQVKWRTNNPNDPSKLKIWGDDDCGKKHVNQKLYITETGSSRGGSNSGNGFGPPQQTGKGVTLYRGWNYQSFSETYTRDVPNLGDTAMGHDRALSIQVSPGCEAILYRKSKYLGKSDIFTEDAPNLNHTGVGKFTSSLKVSCN